MRRRMGIAAPVRTLSCRLSPLAPSNRAGIAHSRRLTPRGRRYFQVTHADGARRTAPRHSAHPEKDGPILIFFLATCSLRYSASSLAPSSIPAPDQILAARRFHRGRAMKHFTGPHAHGLISVPLRDRSVSNCSERLTIDKPRSAPRKISTVRSHGPRFDRSRGIIRSGSGQLCHSPAPAPLNRCTIAPTRRTRDKDSRIDPVARRCGFPRAKPGVAATCFPDRRR